MTTIPGSQGIRLLAVTGVLMLIMAGSLLSRDPRTNRDSSLQAFVDAVEPGSVVMNRDEDLNLSGQYDEIRYAQDGKPHLIPLDAIEWGGVARDGIPSIDKPFFAGPDKWDWMAYDPDGLVIGVEVNGKHRAYPLQILIWHEIVNETFEGKHLLVTY